MTILIRTKSVLKQSLGGSAIGRCIGPIDCHLSDLTVVTDILKPHRNAFGDSRFLHRDSVQRVGCGHCLFRVAGQVFERTVMPACSWTRQSLSLPKLSERSVISPLSPDVCFLVVWSQLSGERVGERGDELTLLGFPLTLTLSPARALN